MRDDSTTGAPTLEGYAATFDADGEGYDLGPFRERIHPQAFHRTLSNGPDVRLLIDHEGQPLARTKSGTLQLSTDSTGLHARATLDPSDPDVQRLLPKMRRGDLDQMSFAFRVPKGGDSWNEDMTLRTIHEASLAGGDVSVVTYPANPDTSVAVRAKDLLEARCVFVEQCVREIRVGKTLSAANVSKLQEVLRMIATADDNVDQAQADLADVLGVPNPDKDDPVQPGDAVQSNSARLALLRRKALALSL
jgi:HK97 family phage prohead protease